MLQCQYTFLHQCVRDVLRARKHRGEQENPLYPIYENFNPEYCRGESPIILSHVPSLVSSLALVLIHSSFFQILSTLAVRQEGLAANPDTNLATFHEQKDRQAGRRQTDKASGEDWKRSLSRTLAFFFLKPRRDKRVDLRLRLQLLVPLALLVCYNWTLTLKEKSHPDIYFYFFYHYVLTHCSI